MQRLGIPQLLIRPLKTAMRANATTKRQILGRNRRPLLQERHKALSQGGRELAKRQPELVARGAALAVLSDPLLGAVQHLGQLAGRPRRLVPQHLVALAHPVVRVAAHVPVVRRHVVVLVARLRVRLQRAHDDVAVARHRFRVRRVLLLPARRLEQPLAEVVEARVRERQLHFGCVHRAVEVDVQHDDLAGVVLREPQDLLHQVVLVCFVRALREVIARALGDAVVGDEFVVVVRQAQVEGALARLELLAEVLVLALVGEVCQAVFVRCGVVAAGIYKPGDGYCSGELGVEFLLDQVAHPAGACQYENCLMWT